MIAVEWLSRKVKDKVTCQGAMTGWNQGQIEEKDWTGKNKWKTKRNVNSRKDSALVLENAWEVTSK
jgi:hypothetical protein